MIYLAIAGTIGCTIMAVFKCGLYKLIRDNSLLLDAINTVISALFAVSIIMTQLLIKINPSFWYLDPILSILLAFFMIGFGVKVIRQNFDILRPIYYSPSQVHHMGGKGNDDKSLTLFKSNRVTSQYNTNLAAGDRQESLSNTKRSSYGTTPNLASESFRNWQQADHSVVQFV